MFEKKYDLIVIGSGSGMNAASRARSKGLKVALVENGPLGGTCLNRGCIPSKVIIYPADVMRTIEDSDKIGVYADFEGLDWALVKERMWDMVLEDRHSMEEGVEEDEGFDLYRGTAEFIGKKKMKVGDTRISADIIMISCGVRSRIPELDGLEEAGYLTSETMFDMEELPERAIILGGGYKACEFTHFFSAFGTEVTVVGHNPRLLPDEEPEVSELVLKTMREYAGVWVNREPTEVYSKGDQKAVKHLDRDTGEEAEAVGDEIFVFTGVVSNAPLLKPEKSDIKLDDRGYIEIDEYLETSVDGIWAFGDVLGRNMFRHTANYESDIAWFNAFGEQDQKTEVDEHAVPHAVYTHPQVASVGMNQEEAESRAENLLVGSAKYDVTAKGYAMGEEEGFAKVLVDGGSLKILGASIVGPHAAILLQPIVYMMNAENGSYYPMARSQIIHPSLSEVVARAFGDLHHAHHEHEGSHVP